MKQFWGFVKKEFFHIFRDVRTLLILFGIPIAQLLIFGYVVNNEIKDIEIAILDHSKDEITRQITQSLTASSHFIFKKSLQHENEIAEIFKAGHVREVIIFEPGFGEKLTSEGTASIQLIADATDANTANLIVNYSMAIIKGYSAHLNTSGSRGKGIQTEVRMLYNEQLKSVYMFVPGTMALILILISAMMTSISIAREKEMGTMEVLLVSPLKPTTIIIGKVIPYVSIAFMDSLIIILIARFIFGMPVNGSAVLLMMVNLLYITLALSLGIFISTRTKTQQTAMFSSLFGLMLPTMLLSGFIFPIEDMPRILQWLAAILPPQYYITAIKDIMIKGVGFSFIWKELAILSGMTLVFIFLSIKNFKIRLD